jgi:hypothetical protein
MVAVRIAAAGSWGVALSHRLEPRTAGLLTGGLFQGVRSDCGVCTVISFFRGNLRLYRRGVASILITLAAITSGCGSSSPTDGKTSGTSPTQLLKDEQLYKYEGEGKRKHKVELSRRERVKLIQEARQAK